MKIKKFYVAILFGFLLSSQNVSAQWTTPTTGKTYTMNSIGIGTTNPTKKLNVVGNISVSDPSVTPDEAYYGGLMITKPEASGQYINLVRRDKMAWSIGMVYNTNNFAIGGGHYNSDSNFKNPFFVITSGGLVGVGTTNPISPLHVFGNLRVTSKPSQSVSMIIGSEAKGFFIHTPSAGDKLHLFTYANGNADSSKEMIYANDGSLSLNGNIIIKGSNKIGIGRTDPQYPLDVSKTLRVSSPSAASATNIIIEGVSNKGFHIHTQPAGDKLFFFPHNGTTSDFSKQMIYDSTGSLSLNGNLILKGSSKVGIGLESPGTALDVNGVVRAHEVKVCLSQGCDFVFDKDYPLMSLNELDNFISKNKHLPEVAPAAVMESEGINVSEMNAMLLQKIEELTLYVIAQDKHAAELEGEIKSLKTTISVLQEKIDK